MADNNQVTQWEYKKVDTSNENELNRLGTFSSDTNSDRVLLKRPKIQQKNLYDPSYSR